MPFTPSPSWYILDYGPPIISWQLFSPRQSARFRFVTIFIDGLHPETGSLIVVTNRSSHLSSLSCELPTGEHWRATRSPLGLWVLFSSIVGGSQQMIVGPCLRGTTRARPSRATRPLENLVLGPSVPLRKFRYERVQKTLPVFNIPESLISFAYVIVRFFT